MKPTRFHESERPKKKPLGNRIEFDVSKQHKLIEDRGVNTLWEKSYLCPCRNKMTKAPDTLCPICHGRGIAYLPAKPEKIALQNQDRSVSNIDLGLYDSGTATATTLPDSKITFRDRITVPDVEVQHSLLFDITDRRIQDGMWLAYDTKEITYAVTDGGELLFPEEDYLFDEEKNLFFPRDHLRGKNVSINLTSTLRYIVTDLLKESRIQYTGKGTPLEAVDHLPKKLLLKREDAWVNPTPFSLGDEVTPTESHEDPKREMNTDKGGFFGGALNG